MLLFNKTNFYIFVGSVKKSSFVIIWLFWQGRKIRGRCIRQKICDETKILSGIWIADHGRDNRIQEIADFNCINNLKRWFIDLNCIEIIYNLDKIYPYGVFFVRPYMRLCTMVKLCINRKYNHNTINSIKPINTRQNRHFTTYKNSKILRNT